MSLTQGVLYVHSAPSALCPHVEWAVAGVLGVRVHMEWLRQPAERAAYRAEYSWRGPTGTSARLASALRGWQRLRFEVTEEPTRATEGSRYAYTPTLGVFHATMSVHGDILVNEERIKSALIAAGGDGRRLETTLRDLLGAPWDDELEPFRYAGDGAPVRWLHQVV